MGSFAGHKIYIIEQLQKVDQEPEDYSKVPGLIVETFSNLKKLVSYSKTHITSKTPHYITFVRNVQKYEFVVINDDNNNNYRITQRVIQ